MKSVKERKIIADRGSVLPFLTCRWLKVNDVATDIETFEKTLPATEKPFEGLQLEGVSTDATKSEALMPKVGTYGISAAVDQKNRTEANVAYDMEPHDGEVQSLHFVLDAKHPHLTDRLNLRIPVGHCATLVLDVTAEEGVPTQRNGVLRIEVEEDADLQVVLLNRLSRETKSNQSIAFSIADGGKLRVAHVEMGGARTNYNLSGDLYGVDSYFEEYVAYLTQYEEALDLFYNVRFHGLYSKGLIRANGALFDQSHKSFRGTLDFLKGARGAVGDEEEVAILMNDEAHSVAVPVLLCHEDAVQGNHATSAGRVDEELLFYLMSRGLSRKEAEGMVVESRMAEALDRIPDLALRNKVRNAVHDRLMRRG